MTIGSKLRSSKAAVPMFKKRSIRKKTRSVPSLIAENKKVLERLKPKDPSSESDISSSDEDEIVPKKQLKKLPTAEDDEESMSDEGNVEGEQSDEDEDEEDEDEDDDEADVDLFDEKAHKNSLAKLKDTDPEFYQFLEDNDKKLLQFDVSGSESDGASDEEKVHKPPKDLEVDSDEDDFAEGEAYSGSGKLITLAMVKDWQSQLHSEPSVQAVSEVVKGFLAALQTVSADDSEDNEYRVDGSSVFNAVVQMCVLELQPALVKLLNLKANNLAAAQPAKSKKWSKLKNVIKNYLTGLLKLLGAVSSSNLITVLLKHLHQLTVFVGFYHNLTKAGLRQLVTLWSTSAEETVRVVAFLCILRITTNQQKSLLNSVLKMMYVAYVSNSKFVSVSTLPNINFMRRSLVEMFALDAATSYQHTFLYVRQLAIHLRNAVTVHKKESIQAVCNWQYMNSLRLWVDLICFTDDKSPLRALLYPVVQVVMGCIKLVSTAQYIPLRFHCCRLLTKFTQETATYIPVLPFIVETLTLIDFSKRPARMSLKPLELSCVLRVNKSGLTESGFRDSVVEEVYQLLIEYCAAESHRLSFPDIVVPCTLQLRNFLKECKVSKYSQKLRQALNKIEESSRHIEAARRKVTLSLGSTAAVAAWEANQKQEGTPLTVFYENWRKINQRQAAKRATDNDKLGDFKLPKIKKSSVRKQEDSNNSPVELFPSDSDSDSLVFGDKEKSKKKKKVKKTKSKEKNTSSNMVMKMEVDSGSDEDEDIVEELRLSDLE